MATLSGDFGFLGYGNMGAAIAAGMVAQGTVTPRQISVYDPDTEKVRAASALGFRCVASAEMLAQHCDTLLLAVKPQMLEEALAPVCAAARPDACVLSVIAGISIARLQVLFGAEARILRVMPNTPALAGAGAAAVAAGTNCTKEDIARGRAVFESVGIAEVVPEAWLDGVTALSGSGPAYFFYLTECLINAAVRRGIPESTAAHLAAQTLYGAGKLLIESGESPATLREKVTSKGGTTFAALERMRGRDLEGLVQEAFDAAEKRSRELGAH
ncbi:MAG TPA: pyrroline-5-carboxylate reductase [Candidatus Hydrogenedentes bacterium]|nr:pyrroline-5-carboxylate reductase [Candidatus Hydrogenedentota bacterium]